MGEQITYSISEAIESSTKGVSLSHYGKEAFDILIKSDVPPKEKTQIFAQMARFNTLYMIAKAGSGHLGGSFSSLDIVSWLYLNVLKAEDRYFSSKGHDAPALYAVHTALGVLPMEKIHALRRLGGLPGHPDTKTPGAHTNTGSLGMGVSKAKGFLYANEVLGNVEGSVFVLTGDGELQEGQFWESLVSASKFRNGKLTVIVDHNKIQSDTFVANVSDLGDLEAKFKAFGWDVHRIDGHNYDSLNTLLGSPGSEGKPLAIIADTIKGKGVSFMEHTSMQKNEEYYRYHSGAPSPEDYVKAANELKQSINTQAEALNISLPETLSVEFEPLKLPSGAERMIPVYSEALLNIARSNPKVVALDADLVLDTGLIPFKNEFPKRFIECGIAEQDMVSQAGTMALSGLIPVVHSFACFLTSRASEQIYNNCTQGGKVVYVGSLAGVLPGGPGSSHQAVRDIAAMSAMPDITIIEPVSPFQVNLALNWAIRSNEASSYLRLASIPIESREEFNQIKTLEIGKGNLLRKGGDTTFLTLGPIVTIEALKAAQKLSSEHGIECKVIATPWANACDVAWLKSVLTNDLGPLVIVENHYLEGGFGEKIAKVILMNKLTKDRNITMLGISGLPKSGLNSEVLKAHGLDSESLVEVIKNLK
ncbi:transketolase C-terminal domain-containing protein [Pedobacter sp. P351]|uniref:transketolase C-terminal domain-containing protein n=1 Tax=Pedobacter superstes TaxID=3133441 RepID=UPI0030974B77